MENENKPSLLKSTFYYGSILGIIMVIYSACLFIFNVMPVGIMKPILLGLISIIFYIAGIVIFAKKIRNFYYSDVFPYGQAFLTCFQIALFALLISTIYSYIQNKFLDPDYFNRIFEAQKNYMENFMSTRGVSEEQIQQTIDKMSESMTDPTTPIAMAKSFFTSVIINALASLVIAGFIQRKPKLFSDISE